MLVSVFRRPVSSGVSDGTLRSSFLTIGWPTTSIPLPIATDSGMAGGCRNAPERGEDGVPGVGAPLERRGVDDIVERARSRAPLAALSLVLVAAAAPETGGYGWAKLP